MSKLPVNRFTVNGINVSGFLISSQAKRRFLEEVYQLHIVHMIA